MDVPDLTAYALAPVKPINRALIEAEWDTLLRLLVSLKQKHVMSSTVLKRLNSYSQHHLLYLAQRELGRGAFAPNSCCATWTTRICVSALTRARYSPSSSKPLADKRLAPKMRLLDQTFNQGHGS
jgi:hypothetical protein